MQNRENPLSQGRVDLGFFPKKIETNYQAIQLKGYPPLMEECFKLLRSTGAEYFALFGGAVRDADYAARHNLPSRIKDYDLRVWLSAADYKQQCEAFLNALSFLTQTNVSPVACPGTDKVHYIIPLSSTELDISIRPIPDSFKNGNVPAEAVALDRINDCDIGLCAVAIDPSGQAWAKPEYIHDQTNNTLSIYSDNERCVAYANRMKIKFPEHECIWMGKVNKILTGQRLTLT